MTAEGGDGGPQDRVAPVRAGFASVAEGGLDRESFPLRLWEKSKRLGVWNPADVDLEADRADWASLDDGRRDVLLRLTALFQAGEEAVTVDLLPLIRVVADEGRLEEEMYLAAFLWEEAKHVDAFRRFFEDVARHDGDLSDYHTAAYRELFYRELPASLRALDHDPSPVAQARASVTYHMIVEGVLAETGYHGFARMLDDHGLMPGTRRMLTRIQRDESRHLAYGVWLLSRLVAEHGEPVWEAIEARMGELLEIATATIVELFDAYDTMPFDLKLDEFLTYAVRQFQKRTERIELARGRSLEEVRRSFVD